MLVKGAPGRLWINQLYQSLKVDYISTMKKIQQNHVSILWNMLHVEWDYILPYLFNPLVHLYMWQHHLVGGVLLIYHGNNCNSLLVEIWITQCYDTLECNIFHVMSSSLLQKEAISICFIIVNTLSLKKMSDIFQMAFSNTISWLNVSSSWFKFNCSFFQGSNWQKSQQ